MTTCNLRLPPYKRHHEAQLEMAFAAVHVFEGRNPGGRRAAVGKRQAGRLPWHLCCETIFPFSSIRRG
jgi:hypothetical protein